MLDCFRLIALLPMLAAMSATASAERPMARPTCAIVVRIEDREALAPTIALLEQQLIAAQTIELVDRQQIDRLIDEQMLSQTFGPAGGASRLALGRLIQADLLLLIRRDAQVDGLQVVIAETERGLRVLAEHVRNSDGAVKEAGLLAELVTLAVAQSREPIKAIVAVPPFANRALRHDHDHLQAAYARLCEELVRRVPGAWPVELAEARAIASELTLAGDGAGVQRTLPLIVLGEYEHHDAGRTVDITVSIRRGERLLGSFEARSLAAEASAAHLREQLAEQLGTLLEHAPSIADPAADAKQLADRADFYERLGHHREALALAQASLLVNYRQVQVHVQAMRMITHVTASAVRRPRTLEEFEQAWPRVHSRWRAGLEHNAYILRWGTGRDPAQRVSNWGFMAYEYATVLDVIDGRSALNFPFPIPRAVHEARQTMWLEIRRTALEAAEAWQPEWKDNLPVFYGAMLFLRMGGYTAGEGRDDQMAARMRLLRAMEDMDDVSLVIEKMFQVHESWLDTESVLNHLREAEKLSHPEIQAAARAVLDRAAELTAGPEGLPRRPMPIELLRDAVAGPDPLLRKLALRTTDAANRTVAVFPSGWLSNDDGIDLVWENHERRAVYLVEQRGQLRQIYRGEDEDPSTAYRPDRVSHASYDGRYFWLPLPGKTSELLIIDPRARRVWRFGESDGLPPMNCGGAVAALAEGEACLVGGLLQPGTPLRTWYARATFDEHRETPLQMEVFFEGRRISTKDYELGRDTQHELAGRPAKIMSFRPLGHPDPRLLIVRVMPDASHVIDLPAVIHPRQGSVKPMGHYSFGSLYDGAWHQGRFYYYRRGHFGRLPRLYTHDGEGEPTKFKVDAPPMLRLESALGQLIGLDDEGKLWRVDVDELTHESLGVRLPGEPHLVRSAHYGLVTLMPIHIRLYYDEQRAHFNDAYVVMIDPTHLPADAPYLSDGIQHPSQQALESIQTGMTMLEVVSRLGRPDYYRGTGTREMTGDGEKIEIQGEHLSYDRPGAPHTNIASPATGHVWFRNGRVHSRL